MKVFRYLSSLLLLLSAVYVRPALAQSTEDTVVFWQDQLVTPPTSWRFQFKYRNVSKSIRRITFDIATAGASFDSVNGPGDIQCHAQNTWLWYPTNGFHTIVDSVDQSLGSGITPGAWDSCFIINLDTSALMKTVAVTWRTWYSPSFPLSQPHTVYLFSRYDNFSPRDTGWGIGSVLPDCDASFNLSINNRNALYLPIDAVRFRLADVGNGSGITLRPSAIKAPDGWVLDSVTTSDAWFHTNSGFAHGQTQSGFIVTVRGNPQVHNYNIEWTTFNGASHIDYDTAAVNATPCFSTADPSPDTLLINKINACSYNVTTENFHVNSTDGVSKISRVVLASSSSSVKFGATPNIPNKWAVYLSPAKDSLYLIPQDPSAWLPGGISNTFTMLLDNQKPQSTFGINWATYSGATLVSSGSQMLACEIPPVDSDLVTFSQLTTNNCTHVATVLNKHYPQSNDRYVTYTLRRSEGTFDRSLTPGSSKHWTGNIGNGDTVLRFTAVPDSDMSPYQVQFDTFRIKPANSDRPVTISWVVQDTAGHDVGDSTQTIQCTIPPPPCDSLVVTHSACGDTIRLFNKRLAAEGTINKAIIMPQGGWLIQKVFVPTIPQPVFSADSDSVTVSNPSGLTLQPIILSYMRKDSSVSAPFNVLIETYASKSGHICDTTIVHLSAKDCPVKAPKSTVGVEPSHIEQLSLNAFPNPFSGHTEVTFALPEHEYVDLALIDVMGRVVQTSLHGMQEIGDHSVSIDGSQLAPGTYYLRLETPYSRITKKLVINR